MARPQTATEPEILAAAGRVIDRDGMDAFTLAAVAREVGLTRAGIAFRFDNARRLKLAALGERARKFEATMEGLELERGGNGLLKLARFIGTIARNPRNLISYMASSQGNLMDPDLIALEHRRGASLRAAIARAMPADVPDPDGALDMFTAHITGSLVAWAASEEPDGAEFLARRTRVWLVMTGIALSAEPAAPVQPAEA
jgi:AcrR family transcriptional regulator